MTYNGQLEIDDYYKVLDVSRHASQSEIKEAWKKKLREYDINKLRYFGEKIRGLAEKETQLINEAYEVLSDPEKRKVYNQTIGRRIGRKSSIEEIQDLKIYAEKQAEIYNNRAIQHWQERRYEKAIAEWKKGIQSDRSRVELYHNLANAYLNLVRYEEAIEVWKKAIEIQPNFSAAYHNLGCAYYRIGEPHLAAESWKMTLELDPDCLEARKNIDMLISKSIIKDLDVSPYKIGSSGNNSRKGIFSKTLGRFRKKT